MKCKILLAAAILVTSVSFSSALLLGAGRSAASQEPQAAAEGQQKRFFAGHWHTPNYWEYKELCESSRKKDLCEFVKIEDKMAKKCDDGNLKGCHEYGKYLLDTWHGKKEPEYEGGIAVLRYACSQGLGEACKDVQKAIRQQK